MAHGEPDDAGRARAAAFAGVPAQLRADLDVTGYYPEVVSDVLSGAVAGEEILDHVVQIEAHFDHDEIHRHITVLALTPTRLVITHVDDRTADEAGGHPVAQASAEAVPLGHVSSVVMTYVVADPEQHTAGAAPTELTMTIGWGTVSRLELTPYECPDPNCQVDHGYSGALTRDDLVMRFSERGDGAEAVRTASGFVTRLNAAIHGGRPRARYTTGAGSAPRA